MSQFGSPSNDIYFKDLETGAIRAVAVTAASENMPVLSKDGTEVLYSVIESGTLTTDSEGGTETANLVPVAGGLPVTICHNCGTPRAWSSDKSKVLFEGGPPPSQIKVFDRSRSRLISLLEHPSLSLFSPRFSPDDQWISFHARSSDQRRQIFVARYRTDSIPQSDWIAITNDTFNNAEPRWSPSGSLIYFLSDRDGFLCLWTQRLDTKTQRPIGDPWNVYHFHRTRLSPVNVSSHGLVGLAIAPQRIVLTLGEVKGNVWLMDSGAAN